MAEASYPSDLKYHPEHDWARVDGDVATFGITWYAQEQLGEVVFFDPPRGRRDDHQGRAVCRGRVRQGRLRRHRARSSGEIVEVNEALGDAPEAINDDPYGEGWMVKVRLADPSEVDALMDAEAYEAVLTS